MAYRKAPQSFDCEAIGAALETALPECPGGRGLCPPSRGPALGRLNPEGILPLPAPPRGTSSLGGWMLFRPPGLHSPSGALRCLAAPARLTPCTARTWTVGGPVAQAHIVLAPGCILNDYMTQSVIRIIPTPSAQKTPQPQSWGYLAAIKPTNPGLRLAHLTPLRVARTQ